jgi:hypothetical protein
MLELPRNVADSTLNRGRSGIAKGKNRCLQSARGPLGVPEATASSRKEEPKMMTYVGKPAPDFEASALVQGTFKNVKLSDYRGHWVVLCFYPGDFTFV